MCDVHAYAKINRIGSTPLQSGVLFFAMKQNRKVQKKNKTAEKTTQLWNVQHRFISIFRPIRCVERLQYEQQTTNLFKVSTVLCQNLSSCLMLVPGLFNMRGCRSCFFLVFFSACCHACHCAHEKSKSIPLNINTHTHTQIADTTQIPSFQHLSFFSRLDLATIHTTFQHDIEFVVRFMHSKPLLAKTKRISLSISNNIRYRLEFVFWGNNSVSVRKRTELKKKKHLLIYGEFFGCFAQKKAEWKKWAQNIFLENSNT